MGWFSSLARTAGSAGNDAGTASFNNQQINTQAASDKLKQIMAGLQIQQLRDKLSQPASPDTKTPEGIRNYLKGVLGREPTPDEMGQFVGIKTAQPPAFDKEKLRSTLLEQANTQGATPLEKRVYSGLIGSLDAGMAPEKVMEDYNRFLTSRSETGTPPKDEMKTEIFGGYRWQYDPAKKIQGTRDATGQYVRLGLAKEPGTGEGGKTPFELWRQTHPKGTYDDWVADSAKPAKPKSDKPIPPDVLNFLKAPVPDNPTPADSQRLAQAADKVFGGTTHRQDLLTRGRQYPLMGLRAPYKSQAYTKQEYQDILNSIKQSVGQDTSTAIPPPPSGAVIDK